MRRLIFKGSLLVSIAASLLAVLIIVLAFITNVPTEVNAQDDAAFRNTLGLTRQQGPLTYSEEIELLHAMQRLVLERAPFGPGIPEYESREPTDLLRAREGLCYDRSRTFDKLFSWHGLKSRHVYVLFAEHPSTGKPLGFWRAFLTLGTQSHAVTEVQTQRGWVVVDSNTLWISTTKDGEPVDSDSIRARWLEFDSPPSYFNRPYYSIRGMYSRRGQFYRPYVPFPQLNWPDYIAWLIEEVTSDGSETHAQQ